VSLTCAASLGLSGACGFSPSGADPGGVDGGGDGGAEVDAGPLDVDDDGVLDSADNCPGLANPAQRDHDGDDVGDVCDPCPQRPVAETGGDSDGDGVGDACDPRPGEFDRIGLFEGFYTMPAGWSLTGTWDVVGGQLRHATAETEASFALVDRALDPPYQVEASVTVDAISAELDTGSRHAGVAFGVSSALDAFYVCSVRDDSDVVAPARAVLARYGSIDQVAELANTNLTGDLAVGATFRVRGAHGLTEQSCLGVMGATSGQPVLATAVDPGKGAGLRTYGLAVRYDYLIVYQPGL